jgi:uncharacterized protein
MIAIILSPIYILVNIYIVKWLIKWTEVCSNIFKNKIVRYSIIIIYTFFSSSFIIGFLLPYRTIKVIGNYWLGVVQFIVLTVIIADLIRKLLIKTKLVRKKIIHSKRTFIIVGFLCIIIVSSLSTYGVIHSKKIINKNYNITINKKVENEKSMKISLISDLHLGYNTTLSHIKNMVNKINENNSDLVVIAGDVFDNNYNAIDNPKSIINELKKIKAKYGVYAVYGNHDIEEPILAGFTFNLKNNKAYSNPKMEEFLNSSNIKLLRDEVILIDNKYYLVGRLDYHKYGLEVEKRKTIEELLENVDKTKPIFVLDHEPYELEELSNNGVDLDLSGHTHNGQMFPSNIFIKLIWKNAHGLLKINNMYSVVTSGIGVYGPNMRVGTTAEVVNINIKFKE